jgi:hypothetical protein
VSFRRAALTASAIDVLAAQFPGIHSVQTVHVNGGDERSIGHLSIGKTLDTAGAAEKVSNRFLVEEILGEITLSGLQPKILSRRKREHEAHALAPRAVAGDCIFEVYADIEPNSPTLASAFILCECHGFNLVSIY